MTVYFNTDEEQLDEVQRGLIDQAQRAIQPTVQLADLPATERNLIEGVKKAGLAIQGTPQPKFHDRLDLSKLSPLSGPVNRVEAIANSNGFGIQKIIDKSIFAMGEVPRDHLSDDEAISNLTDSVAQIDSKKALLEHEMAQPKTEAEILNYLDRSDRESTQSYEVGHKAAAPFPNLAREIMQLGVAMEKFHTEEKLGLYKKQGDECKAKIDLLLKLSAQLPKMNPEDGSYEVKEEVNLEISRISEELRAQGIDIFPGMGVNGAITKQQLASASSLINHHIDANRTTLQELFTTKISISIQFLQMMNEVMKRVAELDDRQKRKALELR